MVIVVYTINGHKVSPHQTGSPLQTAMLEDTTRQVQQQLGALRCPIHHRAPRVHAAGVSIYALAFSVTGCCQVLIEPATGALSALNEQHRGRHGDAA